MARRIPAEQKAFARRLRREMTVAETFVWRALRDNREGAKFRRQVPIGPYVADFLCFEARLVVELDGPPHEDTEQRAHDACRDAWFRDQGFRILRFPNDLAIGGTEVLVQHLRRALVEERPSPLIRPGSAGPPSPARGEGRGCS